MTDAPESDFRIGPYRVLRHVAQGGMGAVYRVEDTDSGAHYAMKLAATNRNEAQHFALIHKHLSVIEHPGIVRSHRCGITEDGRHYMLFDFIGGSPSQVFAKSMGVPGTPARTTAVITVAIHLAEALDCLHERNIIHRDVKSANVLVRNDRSACLIDFDSAIMPGAPQTSGRFVGTYTYAPPEQIRGDSVDARSDVYAMGILLFRMLSGKRPFEGETPQDVMAQHLHRMPEPLDRWIPDAPPRVVRLIASMLEKDPRDRPASAKSVADMLRQC